MPHITSALRITAWIAGTLLLPALLAGLLTGPFIRHKMPEWVDDATAGKYKCSVAEVNVNFFTRSIILKKLSIEPVGEAHATTPRSETFTFQAAEVGVFNIALWDVITCERFECAGLQVVRPYIHIQSGDSTGEKKANKEKEANDNWKEIVAGKIDIIQPHIVWRKPGSASAITCYGKVGIYNWIFRPYENPHPSPASFMQCKKADVSGLAFYKTGSLYRFSLGYGAVYPDEKALLLSQVHIWSGFTYDEFYNHVGHQKSILNLTFPDLKLEDINWKLLSDSNQLMADRLTMKNCVVKVFNDRLQPENRNDKTGRYPHQLIQKLSFPVCITRTELINSRVELTEISRNTGKKAIIEFNNINGKAGHITNMRVEIDSHPHCIAALNGKFGSTPVNLRFDFLLSSSEGAFALDAKVGKVQEKEINRLVKAFSNAELSSFDMKQMDFHIQGNQDGATGRFTILYDQLGVALKKENNNGPAEKRHFLSRMVNKLILYPANPMPGEPVRTVETMLQRPKNKSFFNLISKCILDGAARTTVKNEMIKELVSKKKTSVSGKK